MDENLKNEIEELVRREIENNLTIYIDAGYAGYVVVKLLYNGKSISADNATVLVD